MDSLLHFVQITRRNNQESVWTFIRCWKNSFSKDDNWRIIGINHPATQFLRSDDSLELVKYYMHIFWTEDDIRCFTYIRKVNAASCILLKGKYSQDTPGQQSRGETFRLSWGSDFPDKTANCSHVQPSAMAAGWFWNCYIVLATHTKHRCTHTHTHTQKKGMETICSLSIFL